VKLNWASGWRREQADIETITFVWL